MDHHKGVGANAEVDGFEDNYFSGADPMDYIFPDLETKRSKKRLPPGLWVSGWGQSWRLGRGTNDSKIGAELKEDLQTPGWSIGFSGFGECLPYAENQSYN
jgi:hypothetical protein